MYLGDFLYSQGFRQTAWLDQDSHEERHGTFDPSVSDPSLRYGSPGLRVFGWPARNYTGAHSTGGNWRAADLYWKALDVEIDATNDITDLDFIEGATQFVIAKAKEKGLIVDPVTTPPNPDVPPVNPPAPKPIDIPSDIQTTLDFLSKMSGLVLVGSGVRARIGRLIRWVKTLKQ